MLNIIYKSFFKVNKIMNYLYSNKKIKNHCNFNSKIYKIKMSQKGKVKIKMSVLSPKNLSINKEIVKIKI